jgi:chaperone modulatory protein CbpM
MTGGVRFYSETELVAAVEGLTVTRLRSFVEARCIVPQEAGGRLVYGEGELARARLLAELAEDFDLDADSAGLVLSLVDRVHALRRDLRALSRALAEEPEELHERLRVRIARMPE